MPRPGAGAQRAAPLRTHLDEVKVGHHWQLYSLLLNEVSRLGMSQSRPRHRPKYSSKVGFVAGREGGRNPSYDKNPFCTERLALSPGRPGARYRGVAAGHKRA